MVISTTVLGTSSPRLKERKLILPHHAFDCLNPRRRELSLLRRVLNVAKRDGWIIRNPFDAGRVSHPYGRRTSPRTDPELSVGGPPACCVHRAPRAQLSLHPEQGVGGLLAHSGRSRRIGYYARIATHLPHIYSRHSTLTNAALAFSGIAMRAVLTILAGFARIGSCTGGARTSQVIG
jgi:hypothetical protein